MKSFHICMLVFIFLIVFQNSGREVQASDDKAMAYFELGLKSSMAFKKIEYFTKALELDPRLAPAYEKRGMFYFFQEKYDNVIEDFTRYTRLAPDKADAYRMLGMAYLKIGKYHKAIGNFDRSIKIAPEAAEAFCYRAEALRRMGKLNGALRDSSKAIVLAGPPRILSDAYRTRANIYLELGDERRYESDLKKGNDLDPELFFYNYFSNYSNIENLRLAGLIGMVCISFVLIFGLKLRVPNKDE